MKKAPAEPWWIGASTVEFGFIRSVTPLGSGYKVRIDLHLLFGPDQTGIQACIDNGDCPPGTKGFLDDAYDRDLKFVVTYYLAPDTPVTLVGSSGAFTTVAASYFYGLAHGRNPHQLKLFYEPNPQDILTTFGFYLKVGSPLQHHDGFEEITRLGQVFHP